MKLILVLYAGVTSVLGENILKGYHELFGIPLAARILKAETAMIRSGANISWEQPVALKAHPYLVGVVIHFEDDAISACSSTMLSNTRVITAGHSWRDIARQAKKFTLVFESDYIFLGRIRVDTSDVHEHVAWDGLFAFEFDLAIANFIHISYSYLIQPISLPSGLLVTRNLTGVWAQVAGWGMTGVGLSLPADQRKDDVNLQEINNVVCRLYYNPALVTKRILCTNGAAPAGVCCSDSGGPLSIIHYNQRVLIGVVSFGSSMCEDDFPSGFVRVTAHLTWIHNRL